MNTKETRNAIQTTKSDSLMAARGRALGLVLLGSLLVSCATVDTDDSAEDELVAQEQEEQQVQPEQQEEQQAVEAADDAQEEVEAEVAVQEDEAEAMMATLAAPLVEPGSSKAAKPQKVKPKQSVQKQPKKEITAKEKAALAAKAAAEAQAKAEAAIKAAAEAEQKARAQAEAIAKAEAEAKLEQERVAREKMEREKAEREKAAKAVAKPVVKGPASSAKPFAVGRGDMPIKYDVWIIQKGVTALDKEIVINTPTWEMGKSGYMSQIWLSIMDDKLLVLSSSDIDAIPGKSGIRIDGGKLIPFSRIEDNNIGVVEGDWLNVLSTSNTMEIFMGFFPGKKPRSDSFSSDIQLENLPRIVATYKKITGM